MTHAHTLAHAQELCLGSIRVSDPGFRLLQLLPQLRGLTLTGHLALSLGALATVAGAYVCVWGGAPRLAARFHRVCTICTSAHPLRGPPHMQALFALPPPPPKPWPHLGAGRCPDGPGGPVPGPPAAHQ